MILNTVKSPRIIFFNLKYGSKLLFFLACFILLLLYSSCKKEKILAPLAVIDYIHIPQIHPQFREADQYKYDLDYISALRVYNEIWHSGSLTNRDDTIYCLNQLAWLNLSMYRDSVAGRWIEKTEQYMTQYGGISAMGKGEGDYWYNKAVWGYNTGNVDSVSQYLQRALYHHRLTYSGARNTENGHLKLARDNEKAGSFYISFKPDSAYNYVMDAFDFFQNHPDDCKKYSAEALLTYAVFCRWERQYATAATIAHHARMLAYGQPYVDSMVVLRSYCIETYSASKSNPDTTTKKYLIKNKDYFLSLFGQLSSTRRFEAYPDFLFALNKAIYDTSSVHLYAKNLAMVSGANIGNGSVFFDSLYHKGLLYEKKGDNFLDSSISYYRRSLENMYKKKKMFPVNYLELAQEAIVEMYEKQENYAQAFAENRKDILFGTSYEDSRDPAIISSSALIEEKKYLYYAYGIRGSLYLSRYKHEGYTRKSDLDSSLFFLNLSDDLFFPNFISYNDETTLRYLSEVGGDRYNDAVEASYLKYETQKNPEQREQITQNVFKLLEHRKAFLLYKDLRLKNRSNYSSNERKLMVELSQQNALINELGRTKEKDKLYGALQQRDSLILALRKTIPGYFMESTNISDMHNIVSGLSAQKASLLHYCITDDNLYILLINSANRGLYRVNIPAEKLDLQCNNLTKIICDYPRIKNKTMPGKTDSLKNHIKSLESTSLELYETLISPVISSIPAHFNKLIISPDSRLNYFPFDALLMAPIKNADANFKGAPFLLTRFSISLTPAWKIYTFKDKPDCIDVTRDMRVLAMTYGKDSTAFYKQLKFVSPFFKDSTIGIGADCNKHFFEEYAPDNDVIYLSIHAKAGQDTSDNLLIFRDSLKGRRIPAITLKAKLTILSACETSLGKTHQSEGTFSIARSFLQAGSQSVVSTLWKISTVGSADLFNRFWMEELGGSNSVENSLFNAKKSFLTSPPGEDADYYHPYYWSGFVCYR
ncbi:MAG: CHAT domain-containing protein [Saprospiraceae bacterium]|nr:CHAT domain-containing protein [Saprospiraceae bacterium]